MASTKIAPSLLSLPREIILQIVESFALKDVNKDVKAITCLAMTSKQSLVLVESVVGSLRELHALEKRFGEPGFSISRLQSALRNRQSTRKLFSNITDRSMGPDLAYLNLNGDLSWLPPLDPEAAFATTFVPAYPDPGPSRTYERLIAETKRLHLKLPISLVNLMRSSNLRRRLSSACDTYFTMDSLIDCPSTTDCNAGGFVLRVMVDNADHWWEKCTHKYTQYTNLYLDPMGQHCVFQTTVDIGECAEIDDEEDEDKLQPWDEDVFVEAHDLEEFFYHKWMNESCYSKIMWEEELSKAQTAYMEHIEPG